MKTELYRAIKSIDINKLIDDDKEELLRIFMVIKNDLIRNHIAFIFSDVNYDKAIPYILNKINEKDILHNNGSLVYALQDMDVKKYFIEIVRIVCEHEYEPRLMAYEIICKYASTISAEIRTQALDILEEHRLRLEKNATDKGENSALHFVEKSQQLLRNSDK